MQIAHLERANMLAMHALARRHGIDCEARRCHSVDIVYDRAQWDVGVRAIEQMRALGCDDEDYEIVDQDEARRRFLTPAALGAFVYEAGSMSGYAFVCGLLRVAVTRGVNLQTSTPVTALERDGEARWTVRTERGDVTARTVVLATNGYTAALCPALQGVIVPLRGQAAAQRPGKRLPTSGLATTYSFIHAGGYEYMISRPLGTRHAGDIVIGGGWGMLPDDGAGEFGETDDTVVERPWQTTCARRRHGTLASTGVTTTSTDARAASGPGSWAHLLMDCLTWARCQASPGCGYLQASTDTVSISTVLCSHCSDHVC